MGNKIPGPVCEIKSSGNIINNRGPFDGTPTQSVVKIKPTPGVSGMGPDAMAKAEAQKDTKSAEVINAEKELDLLRRLYGTMKNSKNTKAYFSIDKKDQKKWVFDATAYINDRSSFFGSTKAYEKYKDEAKKELDADKEKLRAYIDPPKSIRNKHTDWRDGQEVFYCWVKKKFEKDNGTGTEYAKIIKAQQSDKLKKALETVKADYGKSFRTGGFNPRPQKRPGGVYLLGTISEHAVGNAIDIDATQNAQIDSKKWKHILAFTAKTVNRKDLKSKWKSKDASKAKMVYDAFKGVSDEWVEKLNKLLKELKAEEDKKRKAADTKTTVAVGKPATKSPAVKKDPLDVVIENDENLKKIGKAWVKKWKDGFLNMQWALVKELHEEGFNWGAVFSTPDLHHFEL